MKVTDSKVLYLTGDSNITYNGNISVGTENAMRGAFIVEGNTLAGDNINNIQSLKTTNSNNTSRKIRMTKDRIKKSFLFILSAH